MLSIGVFVLLGSGPSSRHLDQLNLVSAPNVIVAWKHDPAVPVDSAPIENRGWPPSQLVAILPPRDDKARGAILACYPVDLQIVVRHNESMPVQATALET